VEEPGRTFIHFTNPEVSPDGEHIAFQGGFPIGPEQWKKAGVYNVRAEAALPDDLPLGEYGIRFGIYQPEHGGARLAIPGRRDSTGRSDGGTLLFTGKADAVKYKPPLPDESTERLNITGKIVDFGSIKTNGAFRLLKDKRLVIPLPGSRPFDIELDLDALGLPEKPAHVEALSENLEKQEELAFTVDGGLLEFTTKPGVFAYRFSE